MPNLRDLHCPICDGPLACSKQQLLSDDEPAALVTLCPTHGQVGSVISRYLALDGGDVPPCNAFVAEREGVEAPRLVHPDIPEFVSASNSVQCLHVCTKLRYVTPEAANTTTYRCYHGRCKVSGITRTCVWYHGHPLWNNCLSNAAWVVVTGTELASCWTYESKNVIVAPRGTMSDTPSLYTHDVTVDYPPAIQRDTYVLALRDTATGITTVHCICLGNCDQSVAHSLVRKYIVSTINVPYSLCGCTNDRGWLRELASSRSVAQEVRLYVSRDHQLHEQSFDIVRAHGLYCCMYCDNHFVILKVVGSKSVMHTSPSGYPGTRLGPVVAMGYYDKDTDTFSAKSIVSVPCTTHGLIRTPTMLSRELPFVTTLSSNATARWREATSMAIPSVTVVASPPGRSPAVSSGVVLDVNMKLINRVLSLCLDHSGVDRILIVSVPSKVFMPLIRSYCCCFLYEPDWEVEASGQCFTLNDIRCASIEDGISQSMPMLPTRVERRGGMNLGVSAMVLGIDDIDYSTVSHVYGYLIQVRGHTDESRLPGHNTLGIPASYVGFDNGTLLRRFYESLGGQPGTEFNLHIYSPVHLHPYTRHVYQGE